MTTNKRNNNLRLPLRSISVVLGCVIVAALTAVSTQPSTAYPIDGYDWTGMRRMLLMQRIETGEIKGIRQPPGATLPLAEVDIRLADRKDMTLPEIDPTFTSEIVGLLGEYADRYAISVLDLSDPDNPRYAEHNGNEPRNPGSVGKVVVALGIFQALADLYPDDIEARRRILRDTQVISDDFVYTDHHTVRQFYPDTNELVRRSLQPGDVGSLYDYLDWMASASSNSAASMVIKQAMLLRRFGTDYPVSEEESGRFFAETPKTELNAILAKAIQEPVTRNGLNLEQLRQGSFFTGGGKKHVPGTSSYATSRELMKYALMLEQGKLVDEFSSREIKRLLYVTERRIRYASSPALAEAAVYFKSGSLYQCVPEPDFVCKKYHGNKRNLMNSLAIVESPAGERHYYYIVTLMSNVLRKNSAVDHQTLATRIHRLIESHHQ
jgi:hypothetical protein